MPNANNQGLGDRKALSRASKFNDLKLYFSEVQSNGEIKLDDGHIQVHANSMQDSQCEGVRMINHRWAICRTCLQPVLA